MTPDEAVQRVKCALAEMGYGDVRATASDEVNRQGDPIVIIPAWDSLIIPAAVRWQVCTLVWGYGPCWSCFHLNSGNLKRDNACTDGNCTAGPDDPRVPPRELLQAAS